MRNLFLTILLLLIVSLSSLTACNKQEQAKSGIIVPVVGLTITGEKLQNAITIVGNLQANEDVIIKSEITGNVEKINFEEGQTVKKGTLLIQVDHKNLNSEMEQAQANFNLADANLKRSKELFENKTISSQAYDQAFAQYKATQATLNKTKQQLDKASIVAPFDGIMGARKVSPGQYVSNNDTLTSISSVNPIKLEFNLAERYLSKISLGQKVEVSTAAFDKQIFTGETFFIAPSVDVQTRTVLAKAKIDNAVLLLKPGMFSRVKLILEEKENAILIPSSAIINREDKSSVFVVSEDGIANYRDITLGIEYNDKIEVTSGLKIGETIITEGIVKLQPGMLTRISYQVSDS
ncbi:MAG: efflux RND transporter periplasmic adaptor subunit [Deltaproteobacteria bacterium]|jgi:membrane fusion protein (multidrug efflux system)|nr:efflux RND transporter periplasmic adaptor subunit [Deltaproteobacteria bacterium]